ncbi:MULTISPECIES: hypothetical protein [Streptomyces]|uniref:Integral membrane protein n=1 Tax=Streptomyces canarius TaxID=285453 RepID=A0ABQ3CFK2_9ACTN|nr:hypothetical protein [Streptomyces canarius]GHA08656.1 hypothetical protein GCM10010345_11260 [Streptomyces canarius]
MSGKTWDWAALALACMWIGGYATGRGRPIRELTSWADWQFCYASRRSPWFWIAVPIVVTAVAGLIVFRPRRSLRNWRAARERDRRRARAAQIPVRLHQLRDR